MVSLGFKMVDPPTAKFAPCRKFGPKILPFPKFAPIESRFALRYGSCRYSAAQITSLLWRIRERSFKLMLCYLLSPQGDVHHHPSLPACGRSCHHLVLAPDQRPQIRPQYLSWSPRSCTSPENDSRSGSSHPYLPHPTLSILCLHIYIYITVVYSIFI